jgi:hypothetical protein
VLSIRRCGATILARLGIFALGDVGRVFVQGEASRRWHGAVGGGAWLSVFDPAYTLSFAAAQSEGHLRFSVQGGLTF